MSISAVFYHRDSNFVWKPLIYKGLTAFIDIRSFLPPRVAFFYHREMRMPAVFYHRDRFFRLKTLDL